MACEIAALDGSGRQKGNAHRRGLKAEADGEIRMLLDLDRIGHACFRGTPVIVSESCGHVADPGGDDFFDATRADQLIELHVGDRPDQRQVLFFLTDDFMARGERDERFQRATHRDRHAVLDVEGDGVAQRAKLVHTKFFIC